MFKKTKVRSILELLGKNLSAREVPKVLGVSRNTVAEVQALFLQSDKSWDDISEWDDDRLYERFYPEWRRRGSGICRCTWRCFFDQ